MRPIYSAFPWPAESSPTIDLSDYSEKTFLEVNAPRSEIRPIVFLGMAPLWRGFKLLNLLRGTLWHQGPASGFIRTAICASDCSYDMPILCIAH
jgi:hypothetical protein